MWQGEAGPERGSPTNITGHRLRHAVGRSDLPAVAEIRRLLRDHLRTWGVPALTDTAELLTTELVTNVLLHTQGGAVMTATLTPEPGHRLRIEVSDSAARRPPTPDRAAHEAARGAHRPTAPAAATAAAATTSAATAEQQHGTSGRGLLLVDALSDAWGVRPWGTGKVVWFELDVKVA